MIANIELIFDNYSEMLKKLKKKTYEANMELFKEEHGACIEEMLSVVRDSDDAAAASREIGSEIVNAAISAFGKNGKIRATRQVDANFFMIYYVFTTIQLTEDENAKVLCDGILEVWNNTFKKTKMGYTDYETLYNSFKKTFLGITIDDKD